MFRALSSRLDHRCNSSPDPNDYDEHGGILLTWLASERLRQLRHGYEFAIVDETEAPSLLDSPPCERPMERFFRYSDILSGVQHPHSGRSASRDPTRFTRFGRFKQVFESRYVDRQDNLCKLPSYVTVLPMITARFIDINPNGPAWSFVRFVQDNDAALGKPSSCFRTVHAGETRYFRGRTTSKRVRPRQRHQVTLPGSQSMGETQYSVRTTIACQYFQDVDLILGIPP